LCLRQRTAYIEDKQLTQGFYMGKIRKNQLGFGAVEVLLALIFVALIVLIGVYVAHKRNSSKNTGDTTKTSATTPTTSATTPKTHTADEATTFVQKIYDDYLAAINNARTGNTQPLGLVGLNAVKDNLTADFYAKAAASHNGSDFSCAGQFLPDKYTASLGSSDKTSAVVALVISNSSDGSTTTSGMKANVDLATLKITSVTCPN
jgi:Flp pilus assembly protein TadG